MILLLFSLIFFVPEVISVKCSTDNKVRFGSESTDTIGCLKHGGCWDP